MLRGKKLVRDDYQTSRICYPEIHNLNFNFDSREIALNKTILTTRTGMDELLFTAVFLLRGKVGLGRFFPKLNHYLLKA